MLSGNINYAQTSLIRNHPAQKVYQELLEKYPTSPLSITAEKYLESLKLGGPVYKPVYQEE